MEIHPPAKKGYSSLPCPSPHQQMSSRLVQAHLAFSAYAKFSAYAAIFILATQRG